MKAVLLDLLAAMLFYAVFGGIVFTIAAVVYGALFGGVQ